MIYTYHSEPVEYTTTHFQYNPIHEFIDLYQHPLLMNFIGQAAVDVVFTERKPAIFFFRDSPNHPFSSVYEKIAKENRGHKDHPLVFFYADEHSGEGNRFLTYLGLPVGADPIICIVQNNGGEVTKFMLDKDINRENVEELISNWRHEAAPAFFKS